MATINKLFQQLYSTVDIWLKDLQREFGIDPAVSVAIAAIILIILILIIGNGRKHRKLKKMVKTGDEKMDQISQNLEETSQKVKQVESKIDQVESKIDQVSQEIAKGRENVHAQKAGSTPGIIYIDYRQNVSAGERTASEGRPNPAQSIQNDVDNIVKHLTGVEVADPVVDLVNEIGDFKPLDKDFDEELPAAESLANVENAVAHFNDRMTGISKSGKEYTEEQLKKQIKD